MSRIREILEQVNNPKVLTESDEVYIFGDEKTKKKAEANLSKAVSKAIGTKVDLEFTIMNGHRGQYYNVDSKQDLVKNIGMKMFKSLKVQGSGSQDSEYIYFSIQYRYFVFGGGSNGISISDFNMNASGEVTGQRDNLR